MSLRNSVGVAVAVALISLAAGLLRFPSHDLPEPLLHAAAMQVTEDRTDDRATEPSLRDAPASYSDALPEEMPPTF